jgi:hypothetical protein
VLKAKNLPLKGVFSSKISQKNPLGVIAYRKATFQNKIFGNS